MFFSCMVKDAGGPRKHCRYPFRSAACHTDASRGDEGPWRRRQIIAFRRQSGPATPLVPEDQQVRGYSTVERDRDGKVYAVPIPGQSDHWLGLHKGKATTIGQRGKPQPRDYISGSQGLFHNTFPDGKRITTFSPVDRRLAVRDPKTWQTRSFRFAQSSVAIGAGGDYLDGRICFFRGSPLYSYSLKAAR